MHIDRREGTDRRAVATSVAGWEMFVARDQRPELVDGSPEIFGQRAGSISLEEVQQLAVVPKLVCSGLLREALPQGVPLPPVVDFEDPRPGRQVPQGDDPAADAGQRLAVRRKGEREFRRIIALGVAVCGVMPK